MQILAGCFCLFMVILAAATGEFAMASFFLLLLIANKIIFADDE